MKKILCSLIAALTIVFIAGAVSADEFPSATYNGKTVTIFGNVEYVLIMNTGLEGATDASYVSQDPSMVQIISTSVWNMDGVPLCILIGKKAGSTTITVNVSANSGKRTIQIPIQVVPYQNPLKSFVIGGVELAQQYAKALGGIYTGIRGKMRVSYVPNPGWEAKVYWVNNNYSVIQIPSGSEVNLTEIYNSNVKRILITMTQTATGLSIDLNMFISDAPFNIPALPDLPGTPSPTTPAPTTPPAASPTPKVIAVVTTPTPTSTPQTKPVTTPTVKPTTPTILTPIPVKKIQLKVSQTSLKVKKGKKVKIIATTSPKAKISFKSKNSKIASVTSKGVVKGKKPGTTYIIVKANGLTKKVKVKVTKKIKRDDR